VITTAALLAKVKARTKTVRINFDGELMGKIDDLQEELVTAIEGDAFAGEGLDDKAPALSKQLVKLTLEANETATVFLLRTITGEDFDDLKRRCPPTEEEWMRYKRAVEAAPMTATLTLPTPEFAFAELLPRLIGRSVVEIDGEEVSWGEKDGLELWAGLYDGARADLGDAAWKLNNKSSTRPISGIGTDMTPSFDPESTTRPNGGSPSPSS
jgi:hypothetical protein